MTALLLLLLKTLLVFAAAGLTLFALRRASAAARHLVCLLTLAALLALPLFSLALPGWQMLPGFVSPVGALLAAPSSLAAPSGSSESDPSAAYNSPHAPGSSPLPQPPGELARRSKNKTWQQGVSGKEGTPGKEGAASSAPTILLLCVYAGGILIALTRPLLGLWGIRQLSRACIPFTDAPVQALAADCAAVLHLTRRLDLRQAAVFVPMTWGSRRPVVLLPPGAEVWPEDRLRAVLLHELAHVRRSDWLGHRFADIVCALYWFHPLAWLTARRLRAESEAACDDMVLASGMAAPEYARHLLDIARALPPVVTGPQTVIAMAQTSHIEGRLKMVLDKTQSRRVLSRRALLAVLGLSLVTLITLAVLRPVVKAHDIYTPTIVTAPASAETLVKIAGVTECPSATDNSASKTQNRWWDSQGVFLPQPVFDSRTSPVTSNGEYEKSVLFAFRIPASLTRASFSYNFPQSNGTSSVEHWPGVTNSQGNRTAPPLNVVASSFPPSLVKTNLRVGVANGPWTTVASNQGRGEGSSYSDKTIIFSPPAETQKGLVLTVTIGRIKDALRIVAVDKQGRVVIGSNVSNGDGLVTQFTNNFDLPLNQLKEFRVQTRPFQWTDFNNVALQPVK